jgi:hypothetical protein
MLKLADLEEIVVGAVSAGKEFAIVETGRYKAFSPSTLGAARRRGYPVRKVGKSTYHVYPRAAQPPLDLPGLHLPDFSVLSIEQLAVLHDKLGAAQRVVRSIHACREASAVGDSERADEQAQRARGMWAAAGLLATFGPIVFEPKL